MEQGNQSLPVTETSCASLMGNAVILWLSHLLFSVAMKFQTPSSCQQLTQLASSSFLMTMEQAKGFQYSM